MIRELFHIGPLAISPFGVMMMLAFVSAYLELARNMEARGIGDRDDASTILLAAGFGGILGGKIYYALLYGDWRLLLDRAGLVWYGGFILGTAGVTWVVRSRKLPAWPVLDAASLGLAIGYAVGRIGCFLVGDDYGVPTELPWGVEFPVGLPPSTAGWLRSEFGLDIPLEVADTTLLAVHPTQLYETLAAFVIWRVGRRFWSGRPAAGRTFGLVLALLASERFLVEFLRAKDDRLFGYFTLAQGISVVVVALGLTVFFARRSASSDRPGR